MSATCRGVAAHQFDRQKSRRSSARQCDTCSRWVCKRARNFVAARICSMFSIFRRMKTTRSHHDMCKREPRSYRIVASRNARGLPESPTVPARRKAKGRAFRSRSSAAPRVARPLPDAAEGVVARVGGAPSVCPRANAAMDSHDDPETSRGRAGGAGDRRRARRRPRACGRPRRLTPRSKRTERRERKPIRVCCDRASATRRRARSWRANQRRHRARPDAGARPRRRSPTCLPRRSREREPRRDRRV